MPKDPRSVQQVQGTKAAQKANFTGGRPKDESTLSDDPRQIRNRLRRAAKRDPIHGGLKHPDGRVRRDIEALYRKPIEDWDMEELAHGRPRNSRGGFSGPTPTWITPIIQSEAKRRLLTMTFGKMAKHIDKAVEVIFDLMTSIEVDDKGKPIVDARTRFAAAQFTLEHFLGRPTLFVEAEVNDITKSAIAAAIVLDDGEGQDHFVLEGELVDDEEEDDDSAE